MPFRAIIRHCSKIFTHFGFYIEGNYFILCPTFLKMQYIELEYVHSLSLFCTIQDASATVEKKQACPIAGI